MWKFFLITVLWIPLAASGARIQTRVDESPVGPFDPLTGTIEILHTPSEEVDADSFTLDGHPLPVKFLDKGEVGDQIRSRYHFDINPEGEGLQALGKVSVQVGNERIESVPITYTVTLATPETGLRLKAFILGDEPFYPGERLKFMYKIYYLGNVELTKEDLPLLEAEGFVKIGPLQVKDSEEKGYRVQSFIQEVEAKAPGNFEFGVSTLEGLINGVEKIQTTVDPFTLTISPFPTKMQPTNFIGTGGEFQVSSKLLTSNNILVGDKIVATITFTGKGNLESVQLPDIFCQPGITGLFAQTETPTFATIENGAVTFTVEMIPLTDLKQEIPSFVFSTYDSTSEEYQTIQTKPIPMTIKPQPLPEITKPPVSTTPYIPKKKPTMTLVDETTPFPIITPVPLFLFYLVLAVAILIGLIQFFGKESLIQFFTRKRVKTSRQKFKEAIQYDLHDRRFYLLMREAFLKEKTLKAKKFLDYLDAIRYGKLHSTKEKVIKRAKGALS